MGNAIAIRIYGKPTGWSYGKGNRIVKEFAAWSRIPVINMECDMFHPCQGIADIMTMQEKLGHDLRGKKFVMSWAYSASVEKPLAVPHSAILGAAMMGMEIILAHPKELALDPMILAKTKERAVRHGGSFNICHDMNEAFKDAAVVYPKAWTVQPIDGTPVNFDRANAIFQANKDWICTTEKMALTDGAIYMHCMPADRGMEVTDEVIDGSSSVVIDQAANRLHGQKGIMSLIMAQ
jgi:N-acetylornithine carbamoyltransferase